MLQIKVRARPAVPLLILYANIFLLFSSGCADLKEAVGVKNLEVPPEFKQKIQLDVSEEYEMRQALRSGYDVGDLQSFHTQHVLPVIVKDAFAEMFSEVEMVKQGAQIQTRPPDVPAVFEVKIVDLAHDIYNEADSYRSYVILAVALKSPKGNVFWQKAFRGDGYVQVDPQFSTGLGPQDAIVDAIRNALEQMQKEIISSPEVLTQLRYYKKLTEARRPTDAPST